ncbi:disease resistance protein [Tanacetum coccineum]|uniref:Disease resistance protein n=1 Tax=Tanacetum coccineum TaxID=301880 RepID=A0ABQ5ETT1_9ASTR
MADPITSALVSDLVGRLTSAAIQEVGLLWGLEDDLLALNNTFRQIQGVLHDAEKKQTTQEGVEEWLRTLKSASLEVENVIDEASTEAMIQSLDSIKHKARTFFSSHHNPLLVKTRIAHKVKNIRKKLEVIDANRSKFQLTPSTVSVDAAGVGGQISNRETSSLVNLSKIYGRDEEKKMIVDTICNQDIGIPHDDDDVRVYAIWGMGGIGKTTLAQYAYNHETVKTHFELKCWVYVSAVFDVKRITKQIIKAICGPEDEDLKLKLDEMSLDGLQKHLQSKLRGKKYFIIMDDIWIENNEMEKWDELCKALSCGAKGSTVVVTTRKKDTAQLMAKIPELQRNVEKLSKEESWSLFEKLAFPGRLEGENVSSELELVGKEIVEKCNGLPLAVKTMGSLMSTKKSMDGVEGKQTEGKAIHRRTTFSLHDDMHNNRVGRLFKWLVQLPDTGWNVRGGVGTTLESVESFYLCRGRRRGKEMSKDLLIELWMANGFIPSQGDVSLYALGEEIFTCLAQRSFFQDVVEEDIDTGASCKMHDLMHDLAQYVMIHDCAVIEPDKELITSDEVLHLSIKCKDLQFSKQDLKKLRSVRSMLVFDSDYKSNIRQISNHVYLRVLYLKGIQSSTLPKSICKLIHLRYLKISNSDIKVLPESIIYLQNLQTLILEWCLRLRELPKGLRFMRNLQRGLRDAKSANLKDKTNLKSLGLEWSRDNHNLEVLEGLEPNSGLQQLSIAGYKGTVLSVSWLVKLVNLTSIGFIGVDKCEQLPPLGKLPSLKRIKLWNMQSLKRFHDDDDATSKDEILFPNLQELDIYKCSALVSLPSNFPKLTSLSIELCDELRSLPDEIQSFNDLNEITILSCEILRRRCEKDVGEDWPKISHIPHIDIRTSR